MTPGDQSSASGLVVLVVVLVVVMAGVAAREADDGMITEICAKPFLGKPFAHGNGRIVIWLFQYVHLSLLGAAQWSRFVTSFVRPWQAAIGTPTVLVSPLR